MVVYHSDGLHVGIHNRRTNETQSAMLEVLAECIGFGRSRRNLPRGFPPVQLWPSVNETPAVGIEAPEDVIADLEQALG